MLKIIKIDFFLYLLLTQGNSINKISILLNDVVVVVINGSYLYGAHIIDYYMNLTYYY